MIWVRQTGTGDHDTSPRHARPARRPATPTAGACRATARWLVFTWVPRDGSASHVYLTRPHDRRDDAGRPRPGATGAVANGFSSHPAVSADGRFVAFSSSARNSVQPARSARVRARRAARHHHARQQPRRRSGIRALRSRPTARASPTPRRAAVARASWCTTVLRGKTTAVTGGQGISFDPALSGDGTRVAFASNRRDLAATRSTGARTVYVRDLTPAAHRSSAAGPRPS